MEVLKFKPEASFSRSQMENMMKLGPKEMKGSIWDDRGKSKIDRILISYENYGVYSIQFVYVVDGKLIPSEIHGKPSGLYFDIVKLVSITFGTNVRKYGPFGRVGYDGVYSSHVPLPFAYNFGPNCSFGGFHGSDDNSWLYTIGIYVRATGSVAESEADIGKIKSEEDDQS
ncbi:hypothetical protein Lser_V15G28079 [Lactuca serriola]